MSTNAHTKKNSSELKEEVEKTLRKTEEDLESLESTLTPGTFVDELIYRNRPRHPRATYDALIENPIGSTLLVAGSILLAKGGNGKTGEAYVQRIASKAQSRLSDKRDDIQHKTKSAINDTAEKLKVKSHELKDKAKEKGSELYSDLKGYSSTAREDVASLVDIADVAPLTLASLGLTLGATTAASIPLAVNEERLAAKNSDRLLSFRTDFENAIKNSMNEMKNATADEIRSMRLL